MDTYYRYTLFTEIMFSNAYIVFQKNTTMYTVFYE